MHSNWDPSLSMDHDAVDTHHQELFALVSMLDDAVANQSQQKLREILRFLDEYVLEHFDEEEALMKDVQYPGLSHHQTDHAYFRQIVKDLLDDYEAGTFKAHLVFRIRQFVDKLTSHILTVDSQLAAHIQAKKMGSDAEA